MEAEVLRKLFHSSPCLSQQTIEKYLAGELSPHARQEVENHLLDCPLCSDAVEGFQEIRPTLFPGSFEEWKASRSLPAKQSRTILRQLRPFFRIAAVLAVLIITWWLLLRPAQNPDLFARFYQPYTLDIPVNTRSPLSPLLSIELHEKLPTALKAYDNGNFSTALEGLEDVLATDPKNETAAFYAGMSCLELGKYDEAIELLSTIANGQGNYAAQAKWYLALTYLKKQQPEQAKELLQQIVSTNGYQSTAAMELLRMLE